LSIARITRGVDGLFQRTFNEMVTDFISDDSLRISQMAQTFGS